MSKEISLVGGIAVGEKIYGGEVLKNKILLEYIHTHYDARVNIVDTFLWQKNKMKLFLLLVKVLRSNSGKTIILSVSERGAYIFFKVIRFLPWVRKDIYYFITGALPDTFIEKLPSLLRANATPKVIVSEIELQCIKIRKQGISNVIHVSNWKNFLYVPPSPSKNYPFTTLKLFTFSKINTEKGNTILFEALKKVNADQVLFTLDIYGNVDSEYVGVFNEYLVNLKYCQYRHTIDLSNEENYNVLNEYDLMVFPTFHPGEGFAGTIIDCFIAGVPVAASNWNYNPEVITEGKTGFIFQSKDIDSLASKLLFIYRNQEMLNAIRENCIKAAKSYKIDFLLDGLMGEIFNGIHAI